MATRRFCSQGGREKVRGPRQRTNNTHRTSRWQGNGKPSWGMPTGMPLISQASLSVLHPSRSVSHELGIGRRLRQSKGKHSSNKGWGMAGVWARHIHGATTKAQNSGGWGRRRNQNGVRKCMSCPKYRQGTWKLKGVQWGQCEGCGRQCPFSLQMVGLWWKLAHGRAGQYSLYTNGVTTNPNCEYSR